MAEANPVAQAALEADVRGRISFEVYCFIGDARSSMHELHRAAELAALQGEWLAQYMARPDEVKAVGGRFLDDAIATANRAVAKLHEAKAHHENMVAEAKRLADIVTSGSRNANPA